MWTTVGSGGFQNVGRQKTWIDVPSSLSCPVDSWDIVLACWLSDIPYHVSRNSFLEGTRRQAGSAPKTLFLLLFDRGLQVFFNFKLVLPHSCLLISCCLHNLPASLWKILYNSYPASSLQIGFIYRSCLRKTLIYSYWFLPHLCLTDEEMLYCPVSLDVDSIYIYSEL